MHELAAAGAAVLAALVAGVLVGPAAAAAPAGGPIELWASAGNNGAQHIVFVGAIGDYGSALNVNKNGKPNPNGNYIKVRLKNGTFMIDATAMNNAINSQQDPQVGSPATCSAAFTGERPGDVQQGNRPLQRHLRNRERHAHLWRGQFAIQERPEEGTVQAGWSEPARKLRLRDRPGHGQLRTLEALGRRTY
jgi:hypothetical protein